jgi:membrane-associated phospholipid phosphatase
MLVWKWIKGSAFFVLAVLLAWAIAVYNRELFALINGLVELAPQAWHSALDLALHVFTSLGDGVFVVLITTLFVTRPGRYLPTDSVFFVLGLLSYLASGAVVQALKRLAQIPRPLAELGFDGVHHVGEVLRSHSFPSGHAASAMALAGVLFLAARSRSAKVAVLVVGALVALSRVAVGVHWPLDVFVGGVLGYSTSHILYQLRPFWEAYYLRRSGEDMTWEMRLVRLGHILAFLAGVVGLLSLWQGSAKYPPVLAGLWLPWGLWAVAGMAIMQRFVSRSKF